MASDDPRMGVLLREYSLAAIEECRTSGLTAVVVVGFPHDEGVRRNGGRVGAAGGPAAFRQFLPKVRASRVLRVWCVGTAGCAAALTVAALFPQLGTVVNPEWAVDLREHVALFDRGDIEATTLEEAHALLRAAVAELVAHGAVPFVVGGGNDQSYPNAMGLLDGLALRAVAAPRIGAVNLDAHLDVRPLKEGRVHSGSPFRCMLEDPAFVAHASQFVEFAAHGSQCSAEHAAYVASRGCDIVWLSQLAPSPVESFRERVLRAMDAPALFVSFDLDCVVSDAAPGVSCPAAVGLSAADAFAICKAAGSDERVALVDVSELNPAIEGYRTPRVVVFMLYNFLLGVAARRT